MERPPVQTGEFSHGAQGEQLLTVNPEIGNEKRPEIGAVQAEAAQIAMPSLPTPVVTQSDDDAVAQVDGTQLIANDDDLIEKEWVDKAKKILAQTKDDPYKREKEVSKLQIEYVRKRYGRIIGDAGD
jgi:hypothetical protein